jgi:quercetin dioxygenase-like cupin family protein
MNHFIDLKTLKVKDSLPGATAAYFQTEHLTLAFTELKAGAQIPLHNHPQEAVDIILKGELEMQIAGKLMC